MPQFTIIDDRTGHQLVIEADKPPTMEQATALLEQNRPREFAPAAATPGGFEREQAEQMQREAAIKAGGVAMEEPRQTPSGYFLESAAEKGKSTIGKRASEDATMAWMDYTSGLYTNEEQEQAARAAYQKRIEEINLGVGGQVQESTKQLGRLARREASEILPEESFAESVADFGPGAVRKVVGGGLHALGKFGKGMISGPSTAGGAAVPEFLRLTQEEHVPVPIAAFEAARLGAGEFYQGLHVPEKIIKGVGLKTEPTPDDMTPLEHGISMTGWEGTPARFIGGAVETAPHLAAVMALGAAGVPEMAAIPAIFGTTPEGGFDPKAAATAMAIPPFARGVGRAFDVTAGIMGAKQMGRWGAGLTGSIVGPAAGMFGMDIPRIMALPPEQRKQAWIEAFGEKGAMMLGPASYHGPGGRSRMTEAMRQAYEKGLHGQISAIESDPNYRSNPEAVKTLQSLITERDTGMSFEQMQTLQDILSTDEYDYVLDTSKVPDWTEDEPASIDLERRKMLLAEKGGKPGEGKVRIKTRNVGDFLRNDLADMTPAEKAEELRFQLFHEKIHLNTDVGAGKFYWDNSSPRERRIAERIYFGAEGRPKGFSDSMVGEEILRQRMEKLTRAKNMSEVRTLIGKEGITVKALSMLQTTIRGIKASFLVRQEGARYMNRYEQAMLKRLEGNIEGGIEAAKLAERFKKEPAAEGENPATLLRRTSKPVDEFINRIKAGQATSTEEAIRTGLKAESIDDLEALAEQRVAMAEGGRQRMKEILAETDPEKRAKLLDENLSRNPQIPREAIETATNIGSHIEGEVSYGERPLDWRKNPEVAEWLKKNAARVKIQLPDELQEQAPATLRRTKITDEVREDFAKSLKFTKAPYTVTGALGHLESIEIPKSERGVGVGQLALENWERIQVEDGAKKLTTVATNAKAKKFFENNGWRATGEKATAPNYFGKDAVYGEHMEKDVGEAPASLKRRRLSGGKLAGLDNYDEWGPIKPPPGFEGRKRVSQATPSGRVREVEVSPNVWVDESMGPMLTRLNAAGFTTEYADSGLVADHPDAEDAGLDPFIAFSAAIPKAKKDAIRRAARRSMMEVEEEGGDGRLIVRGLFHNDQMGKQNWQWFENQVFGRPADAEAPASLKRRSKFLEQQKQKLAEMKWKAAQEAAGEEVTHPGLKGVGPQPAIEPVPQEERVGAEQGGALPRLTPEQIGQEALKKAQVPSFDDFLTQLNKSYPGRVSSPDQLADAWANARNDWLNKLTDAEIIDVIHRMKLRNVLIPRAARKKGAQVRIPASNITDIKGPEVARAREMRRAESLEKRAAIAERTAKFLEQEGLEKPRAKPTKPLKGAKLGTQLELATGVKPAAKPATQKRILELRQRAKDFRAESERITQEARLATPEALLARAEQLDQIAETAKETNKRESFRLKKRANELRARAKTGEVAVAPQTELFAIEGITRPKLEPVQVIRSSEEMGPRLKGEGAGPQAWRVKAMSEIYLALEPPDAKVADLLRKEVDINDIDWTQGQRAVREYAADDLTSPEVLGLTITRGGGTHRGTKFVVGGGEKVVHMEAPNVTHTKAVVALLDKETGIVHLVSAYRDGRRGPVAYDPRLIGDRHTEIGKMLGKYRPIASFLLHSPVKNFHKRFGDIDEFNDKFFSEARERAEQAQTEDILGEIGVTERQAQKLSIAESRKSARAAGFGVVESGDPVTQPGVVEGELPTAVEHGEGGSTTGQFRRDMMLAEGMMRGAMQMGAQLTPQEARIAHRAFSEIETQADAKTVIDGLADRLRAEKNVRKAQQDAAELRKRLQRYREQQERMEWGEEKPDPKLLAKIAALEGEIAGLEAKTVGGMTPNDYLLRNAIRKIGEGIRRRGGGLTDGQIADLTLNKLYDLAKFNPTESVAVTEATREFAKERAIPAEAGERAGQVGRRQAVAEAKSTAIARRAELDAWLRSRKALSPERPGERIPVRVPKKPTGVTRDIVAERAARITGPGKDLASIFQRVKAKREAEAAARGKARGLQLGRRISRGKMKPTAGAELQIRGDTKVTQGFVEARSELLSELEQLKTTRGKSAADLKRMRDIPGLIETLNKDIARFRSTNASASLLRPKGSPHRREFARGYYQDSQEKPNADKETSDIMMGWWRQQQAKWKKPIDDPRFGEHVPGGLDEYIQQHMASRGIDDVNQLVDDLEDAVLNLASTPMAEWGMSNRQKAQVLKWFGEQKNIKHNREYLLNISIAGNNFVIEDIHRSLEYLDDAIKVNRNFSKVAPFNQDILRTGEELGRKKSRLIDDLNQNEKLRAGYLDLQRRLQAGEEGHKPITDIIAESKKIGLGGPKYPSKFEGGEQGEFPMSLRRKSLVALNELKEQAKAMDEGFIGTLNDEKYKQLEESMDMEPQEANDFLTEKGWLANEIEAAGRYSDLHNEIYEIENELDYNGPDPDNIISFPASLRRSMARTLRDYPPGKVTTNFVRGVGSLYGEWMTHRIARKGGEKAKGAAEVFDAIIDRAKQIYGRLTPLLDKARRAAGGTIKVPILGQVPSPRRIRATAWLNGFRKKITPYTAQSRLIGAMEGKITNVPAYARELLALARSANLATGRILESVIAGFLATGKFQRNLTAYAYDLLRRGEGVEFDRWVQGLARANRKKFIKLKDPATGKMSYYYIDEAMVRRHFADIKKVLDDPLTTAEKMDQINQDMSRFYPEVVSHVKGRTGWNQVIHADLFNYLENTAKRASHIRALREAFPNDAAGKKALQDMIDGARSELDASGNEDLNGIMKTIQGHPTDDYSKMGILSPTEPLGAAFRMANQTVGNLLSKMVLSAQMLTQPGEVVSGSTPEKLGMKNYVKGAAKAGQLYSEMEKAGEVNRVMYDFSFDPHSPLRSLFRQSGNVVSKVFMEQWLNEVQEANAAATARVVSDRIKNNVLTDWERRNLPATFREMGFNQADVGLIMAGDQSALNMFQRRAAAFLTGGNKAIAEGSRWGSHRLFNSVFRFQLYPMTKMNQFQQVAGNFVEAWTQGTKQEKAIASERLARFTAYNVLQGAITAGITAAGFGAFGIKMSEAEDEPLQFLAESGLASMSGPLYLVWRGARDKGVAGVGEQAARVAFPYSIAREVIDLANGQGAYRDRSLGGSITQFIKNKTPGTKAINVGLAVFGVSNATQEINQAIAAKNRWKRDTMGWSEHQFHLENDEKEAFKLEMKQAMDALKSADEDAFYKHLDAAFEATPEMMKSDELWKRSIGRRLELTDVAGKELTEDQIDELEKRIGHSAVERLRDYDYMVRFASKGIFAK